MAEEFRVDINESQSVTAILYPASTRGRAKITLILGHGAGANQSSAFMVNFATELASRGLDVVTFNFFYSEHRRGERVGLERRWNLFKSSCSGN